MKLTAGGRARDVAARQLGPALCAYKYGLAAGAQDVKPDGMELVSRLSYRLLRPGCGLS